MSSLEPPPLEYEKPIKPPDHSHFPHSQNASMVAVRDDHSSSMVVNQEKDQKD